VLGLRTVLISFGGLGAGQRLLKKSALPLSFPAQNIYYHVTLNNNYELNMVLGAEEKESAFGLYADVYYLLAPFLLFLLLPFLTCCVSITVLTVQDMLQLY
jgi:hypothetical protein